VAVLNRLIFNKNQTIRGKIQMIKIKKPIQLLGALFLVLAMTGCEVASKSDMLSISADEDDAQAMGAGGSHYFIDDNVSATASASKKSITSASQPDLLF